MRRKLLMGVAVGVMLSAWACSAGTADSASTIESYFAAYNDDDLAEVMTHFNGDSVIVGHPTDFDPQADDIYSIERLHKEDLRFGETYSISNVVAEGQTVTWDSIWGEDGCVQGHTAVVSEGVIVTWTWGEFVDCSAIR